MKKCAFALFLPLFFHQAWCFAEDKTANLPPVDCQKPWKELFAQALATYQVGQCQNFEALLSCKANDPILLNNLAICKFQANQSQKAEALLTQALNASDHGPIFQNLRQLQGYLARKNYGELGVKVSQQLPRMQLLNPIEPPAPIIEKIEVSKVVEKPVEVIRVVEKPVEVIKLIEKTQDCPASDSSPAPVGLDEKQVIAQVTQALETWRKAWSAQDVTGYLARYSNQFDPNNGMSYSQWQGYKKRVIEKPKFIKIKIDKISVFALGSAGAMTRFSQTYTNDSFSDSVNKIMVWRLDPALGWQIVSEEVLR